MLRLSRWMAKSAFGIGLAVGCMLNVGLAPLLEARGEPVPTVVESVEVVADAGPVVPAFGELQQVNLDLQAKLFERPYSQASPMRLAFEPNSAGVFPGFTDSMDAFVLTIETIRPLEYGQQGALTTEQAQWAQDANWTVYIFAGLLESGTASVWASGLVTCFDAAGAGRVCAVVVGSFSDYQSGVVKLDESTASAGAAAGGATATAGIGSPVGAACDDNACTARLNTCMENFESTMDTCYVSLELALAELAGCAAGLTISLWACMVTGVGCALLVWLAEVCAPAITAAMVAFAGCTALAMATYENCRLRATGDPVCGCLLIH